MCAVSGKFTLLEMAAVVREKTGVDLLQDTRTKHPTAAVDAKFARAERLIREQNHTPLETDGPLVMIECIRAHVETRRKREEKINHLRKLALGSDQPARGSRRGRARFTVAPHAVRSSVAA